MISIEGNKKHMIILIDTGKTFDNVWNLLIIKNPLYNTLNNKGN